MLLDYFDRPDAALLGMNANMPARVFLDGAVALEGATPDKLAVALLALSPGRHVLAVQCRYQNYPSWMQLYLKMHSGAVYTTPEWRHAVNPSGAWWLPDYNDRQWAEVSGAGCRAAGGPYLWVEPNALGYAVPVDCFAAVRAQPKSGSGVSPVFQVGRWRRCAMQNKTNNRPLPSVSPT